MPIYRESPSRTAVRLAVVGLLAASAARATTESAPAAPAPAAATAAAVAPLAPARPAATPEASSYDVGLMLGEQLTHNGLAPTLTLEDLVRGLKEGVAGKTTSAEERDTATQFMRAARDALFERNRTAAHEFLDKNAKKPGIVALPSGLQYRILTPGDPNGVSPGPTDQVTVRYVASLADGTIYDRSETHDRPATFRVNGVFKGWQQAFAAMKPGAKWQLFVPPELGYGANSPPPVPPGALLVYELELLRIEAAAPPPPGAQH